MREKRRRVGLLVLWLLIGGPAAQAQVQSGQCLAVADGDTIQVRLDGETRWIRLAGIDAPELFQDLGRQARETLTRLALGKTVTLRILGTDRDRLSLAQLTVNGVDVSSTLLSEGLAWYSKERLGKDTQAAAERKARAAHRGVWASSAPESPWQWRDGYGWSEAGGSLAEVAKRVHLTETQIRDLPQRPANAARVAATLERERAAQGQEAAAVEPDAGQAARPASRRQDLTLRCVSRTGTDHYTSMDRTHVFTEICTHDAECQDLSIVPGEPAELHFSDGTTCRVKRVWSEPDAGYGALSDVSGPASQGRADEKGELRLACVSKVSVDHFVSADRVHVTTQMCPQDARCEGASILPGSPGELRFDSGRTCRIKAVWTEPLISRPDPGSPQR